MFLSEWLVGLGIGVDKETTPNQLLKMFGKQNLLP